MYHAKFEWWEKSPPEWAILGNFAEYLIDYVKAQDTIINKNDKIGQSNQTISLF
jgi:hypothetical protein